MTTTLQPELTLSAARLKLPMLKRDGARAVLGCDDWQLERELDAGRIRGVIDVASRSAGRTELRFLAVALEEFKRGLVVERTDAELCEAIFGRPQALVRVRWVYSRLNCKHSHLYDLAAEGVLPLKRGSVQRSGPGGSAVIEWSVLLKFIQQRRRG